MEGREDKVGKDDYGPPEGPVCEGEHKKEMTF